MISFEDAQTLILEASHQLQPESVQLLGALGRVLSEPLVAPVALPHFDNSAVDGFGVRVAEIQGASSEHPVTLPLQGSIFAGDSGQIPLQPGGVIRILTGAPVPQGVEAVVMKEYTDVCGETVTLKRSVTLGENIRRRGEEFEVGDPVLPQGTLVTPPVLGVAASLGLTHLSVYSAPRVAVIITGSELVTPGQPLAPGQIYESNSIALLGALQSLGIPHVEALQVEDNADALKQAFADALNRFDVVLTTGGVSVGEMDLVKSTWEGLGVDTVFWKVAIKPGKPFYFGRHPASNTLVFGLPGNPVASLLTFKLLVQPALRQMMGLPSKSASLTVSGVLQQRIRQKPGRLSWVRATLSRQADGNLAITPVTGQGSHMMGGLAQADALLPFGADQSELLAHAPVQAIPLSW